jgi:hypothetical protein
VAAVGVGELVTRQRSHVGRTHAQHEAHGRFLKILTGSDVGTWLLWTRDRKCNKMQF